MHQALDCPAVSQTPSNATSLSSLLRPQVHVLLDALTLTGCLQRLKECAFAAPTASKGGKGRGPKASQQQLSQAAAAEGDDELDDADEPPASQANRAGASAPSAGDMETALCLCVETLQNLAVACQQVPLRSNKEALQAALEGCADLLGCSKAIKAPAGARALGLCTTGEDMSMSSAGVCHSCVLHCTATIVLLEKRFVLVLERCACSADVC